MISGHYNRTLDAATQPPTRIWHSPPPLKELGPVPRNEFPIRPKALVHRKQDSPPLRFQQLMDARRHRIRHEQAEVLGEGDEVPVEEPMAGSAQRYAVRYDVWPAVLHGPNVRRLRFRPARTVKHLQRGCRTSAAYASRTVFRKDAFLSFLFTSICTMRRFRSSPVAFKKL